MNRPLTTSDRMALQPATAELRDAWGEHEAARDRSTAAKMSLAEQLSDKATQVEALGGDAMQRVMDFVAEHHVTREALLVARERWIAEYVRLRGVSKGWARRRCEQKTDEFADE